MGLSYLSNRAENKISIKSKIMLQRFNILLFLMAINSYEKFFKTSVFQLYLSLHNVIRHNVDLATRIPALQLHVEKYFSGDSKIAAIEFI